MNASVLISLWFIMCIWASVFVARSKIDGRLQLAVYFIVIWVVPFAGAIIASLASSLRSRNAIDSDERASAAMSRIVRSAESARKNED